MKEFVFSLQRYLLALLGQIGGTKLFVIALFDSSFLSLPEVNDLLIISLSIQNPHSMFYYCLMTTLGSIAGCLILYSVGRKGGEMLLHRKFPPHKIEKVSHWYEKYGLLAVMIPSILPPPTPFKIFVLSAGAFRISVSRFIIAITIGRGFRYFLEGYLAIEYGEKARDYMQQNYSLIALAMVALIALIALIIYASRKIHQARTVS